jgi:hypothetical protein
MRCFQLESELENLKGTGYDNHPISPQTAPLPKGYNCIAFAAGHTDKAWWPHLTNKVFFWPPHLKREFPGVETQENFIQVFQWKGYTKCNNGQPFKGIEKIVIFLLNGRPTHAARQLESGLWTSKCGRLEDIRHETLAAVEGKMYGKAVIFMHRRRDGKPFFKDRIISLLKKIFRK